ncbi:hypothetical protein ACFV1N_17530 [Streptosporangium canum]|uniref:hypothetical protein n=1 Tax=Streptosporangium canum TaxID=324952 RepID=UPI00367509BC
MRSPLPLAVAGWLIAGSLATTTGVAVIGLLGESLTSSAHRPLSAAEIDEALAAATPAAAIHPTAVTAHPTPDATHPTAATPPASAAPAGPSERSGLISTEGGTAIARCEKGLVTLRAWSPAQGFQTKDVDRGPDRRVRVEFESEETEVKIEVWCSPSGFPVHTVDD